MRSLSLTFFATVAVAASQDRPTREEHEASKAEEQAEKDAVAKKEAKMAAVNKVIQLLEDVQTKVLSEGEKEAATYNEFACFCKDMTVEKRDAITKGEDDKTSLTSKIGDCQDQRDELDTTIETLTDEIKEEEEKLAKETKERKATQAQYDVDESDLAGAISAVENAIEVIKSSKKPSLAQLVTVGKTIKNAIALADVLGLASSAKAQKASAFLQQPDVEMEDYKFKSGKVVETLEGLHKDFRDMKNEVDAAEVKSVAEYDAFKQEKIDLIKAKNKELEDNQRKRSKKMQEIATTSEKLTTTAAVLLDDQQYLAELAQICSDKAKTWDKRSEVRADELSALTAAIDIVKSRVAEKTSSSTMRFVQSGVSVRLAAVMARDPDALGAVEAEAEAADSRTALGFLQRSSRVLLSRLVTPHDGKINEANEIGRQAVIKLLSTQSKKNHSKLLSALANQIAADPFAKIKTLITELIERLLNEAAAESDQKGFCDKATAEAKQKRGNAANRLRELNGHLAENEAIHDKLVIDLENLATEIEELETKQEEAEKMRKEEKAENEATVVEAEEGLEAVSEAMDIIDKFYKTAAKEEVDLDLVQRGPMDDMPDAGFDAGEAYTGGGSDSGGVLGMMDVIKSDFERTIKETKKAEAEAEDEFHDFNTETGKSLAEKNMAQEQKTKQKDKAAEELEEDNGNLEDQTAILKNSIKELLDLKPACVDTGMSYEERVARREDEIESLKKALCIFQNTGDPEGASEC